MLWRFRGLPHYMAAQGDRLSLPRILTDRTRHNAEGHKVSALLAQLCDRYHKARKEDGHPVLYPTELAQVEACLGQCERESEKLHALAATAQAMIDEARAAFRLEPLHRRFSVRCEPDAEPTAPADRVPVRTNGRHAQRATHPAELLLSSKPPAEVSRLLAETGTAPLVQ